MASIHVKNLEGLSQAAKEFAEKVLPCHNLIALSGEMGAGKTTFTSALCSVLGVQDEVTSPTFTIVNEYLTAAGATIYHFDFYRIQRNEEALDLGLYDYLDSGCLCIMEWCENIPDLIPEETLHVHITVNPETLERDITWQQI